jgi:hypothetical protein
MTPEQRVEEAALEIAAVRCLYGRQLPVKAMARAALASSEKLIAELEARIARLEGALELIADAPGSFGTSNAARAALNEDKPHD